MRNRGVQCLVIATDTFRPLIVAQARARKLEPNLVVVTHPIGGLNAEELAARIEEAYAGIVASIGG